MNEAEFKSPLPDEELLFHRLLAREELGRLPEFRLDLLRRSQLKPLQAKQLLGKTAALAITPVKGKKRFLHGHITQFERGGVQGQYDLYRVILRPWLWQLKLGADCRVFQDKTVVQILDAIFAEYGSSGRVDKKLTGSFTTRPYTVQYRESDFDFVSRLMEEEGIYYYFKHESGQHTLVLCNGPTGHSAVEGDKLAYGPKLRGQGYREDLIDAWSMAHLLQPLKFATTDYAAEAPTTDLKASAERKPGYSDAQDWEVFDYPGNHDDYAMGTNTSTKQKAGEERAQREVDRFESLHAVATGVTPYRPLSVGQTFTLTDHPDADTFLVTSSITDMSYGGYFGGDDAPYEGTHYTCRFNAVPKKVAFQPQAVTPVPVVNGPQTAVVTGPSGDEIHTDKYGRVKVKFHWDRVGKNDEKSSCWVRVAHPWAGKGFGMVALPRVGDEVVVDFLEGNPDRPLITGRVYNATNTHPYELPKHATVSGIRSHSSKGGGAANFNELRFEDKKGEEYVWLQAEKDYRQLVKHDAFVTVKNDLTGDVAKNSHHGVGENFSLKIGKKAAVAVGEDADVKLGADLHLAVTSALGLKVGQAIAIKGDAAIALTAAQGLDLKAGQPISITGDATVNVKGMSVVIEGSTQLTLKAGGAFITIGPDGVTLQGPMVKINSGGSAGAAKAAQAASPPSPQEPAKLAENKDPQAGN